MTRTSWVELCVSDFEQSIAWFEHVLGFRVVAREANEYAELSRGDTSLQLAADDAPYWKPERPRLLPPGQRGRDCPHALPSKQGLLTILSRPCLLDNLRLMHNMGETVVAIDKIP